MTPIIWTQQQELRSVDQTSIKPKHVTTATEIASVCRTISEVLQHVRAGGNFRIVRARAAMIRRVESGEPSVLFDDVDRSPLLRAVLWSDGLEMLPKRNVRLSDQQLS